MIVLPGGGYAAHAQHEAEPIVDWLSGLGFQASVFRYPFFVWHTAEDVYVPPEHTYRFAAALASNGIPHAVHVFAHGPHSLGLAEGAGDTAIWTTLAASWIREHARA